MQNRRNDFPFFIVFFSISLLIILLGKSGVLNGFTSLINSASSPAKSSVIDIFGFQNKTIKKLSQENADLRKKILDDQNLILENKALKDQFAESNPTNQSLLPARVVGAPGFIPGISLPHYLILDKGKADKVLPGDSVVSGKNLVGKIVFAVDGFSKVELITDAKSSFTAKVASQDGREVSGIIKGGGNEKLSFENVLLTLALKKGDSVLTKGEKDEHGVGFPPDLIIGKIISVEKKSSDLFQKAEVVSYLDFASLRNVFIIR